MQCTFDTVQQAWCGEIPSAALMHSMWLLVLGNFWPKGEGFLACTVVIVQNSLAVCFHASLKYLCNSRNKKRSLFLKLKAALSVWVMILEEVDREVTNYTWFYMIFDFTFKSAAFSHVDVMYEHNAHFLIIVSIAVDVESKHIPNTICKHGTF